MINYLTLLLDDWLKLMQLTLNHLIKTEDCMSFLHLLLQGCNKNTSLFLAYVIGCQVKYTNFLKALVLLTPAYVIDLCESFN